LKIYDDCCISQKVQVDFVARTAEDFDSHGIRNLLQQVDSSTCVCLSLYLLLLCFDLHSLVNFLFFLVQKFYLKFILLEIWLFCKIFAVYLLYSVFYAAFCGGLVAQRLGVGYKTERSTVHCPANALPSNSLGQVVHSYLPV